MTLADQIKSAKRELQLRERVYPSRIRLGKMSEDAALHEIKAMKAIIETLTDLEARRTQTTPRR